VRAVPQPQGARVLVLVLVLVRALPQPQGARVLVLVLVRAFPQPQGAQVLLLELLRAALKLLLAVGVQQPADWHWGLS